MVSPGHAAGKNDPRIRTIDHVFSKFLGGSGNIENTVYACRGCNTNKGWDLPPAEAIYVLAERNARMNKKKVLV